MPTSSPPPPFSVSASQYHNSHGALGSRARKLDQGILVVRFELPFHVWCDACGHLMAKGVRFNAEKRQVGAYHSTKIWEFSMKTPCCSNALVVRTDPKLCDYIVVSGGRKRVTAQDAVDREPEAGVSASGMRSLPGREERAARLASEDALARLEREQRAKAKAAAERRALEEAKAVADARGGDDFENNRALRRAARSERKALAALDDRRKELGLPDSVRLLPETPEDVVEAHDAMARGRREAAIVGAGGPPLAPHRVAPLLPGLPALGRPLAGPRVPGAGAKPPEAAGVRKRPPAASTAKMLARQRRRAEGG